MTVKKRVLFATLGAPKGLKRKEIRHFLKEFLGNKRVVDKSSLIWKIVLNGFILLFRPTKLAQKYRWLISYCGFQPMHYYTKQLATAANATACFVLDPDSLQHALGDLDTNDQLTVISLFPQYSEATHGLIFDKICDFYRGRAVIPSISFKHALPNHDQFIELLSHKIDTQLREYSSEALILTFHGYPIDRSIAKKDPYLKQCLQDFTKIKANINAISHDRIEMAFHSKFGRGKWSTPSVESVAKKLLSGSQKIAINSPSFLYDCLETHYDLEYQLAKSVHDWGGELQYIGALNCDSTWLQSLSKSCH